MLQDKIYLNGELTSWNECSLRPLDLLADNYVYTIINTLRHKPLHLQLKLRYALDSFAALYGTRPAVEASDIAEQVERLLHYAMLPKCGNTLMLMLLPNHSGGCNTLLTHLSTTPHEEGYTLLYTRPRAIVANYEIALEAHHTALSLKAARFADQAAQRSGGDIAVRCNRAGVVSTSGDNPLFALVGNKLITTPISHGAKPSAERELMMELCRMAKVEVMEEAMTMEHLSRCEELCIFTPEGIKSVGEMGGAKLHNIVATRLEKYLPELTRQGCL